jgi:ADP-heptose:LPS heptosyltransferase
MSQRAVSVAGDLSFAAFCGLIETADLTITNNTGPMHLAAALKTPVIALFALTNPPEQWGPWHVKHLQLYHDVPCRICYQRVCPYSHECLRLVTPSMVVSAAATMLVETGRIDHRPGELVGSLRLNERSEGRRERMA